MDWYYVESNRLLAFVLFVSVPRPYVLQVFGTALCLLPHVGLLLGWGSHAQLWKYMLICHPVDEICHTLRILLQWMPSPRYSSGLVSDDFVNSSVCSCYLLQL
jgi:hypothetical protein